MFDPYLEPSMNKPTIEKMYETITEIWALTGYLMVLKDYCHLFLDAVTVLELWGSKETQLALSW